MTDKTSLFYSVTSYSSYSQIKIVVSINIYMFAAECEKAEFKAIMSMKYGDVIKQVTQFKYFGTVISTDITIINQRTVSDKNTSLVLV